MEQSHIWRTFSIFISSTFADMQAERDYLKHIIFPRVEEELQKRRIKLEIVDLRWGVDTTSIEQEDEREANVLKVCLNEIKRCRPFFIGLLGDRYGWVPPEERMKRAVSAEDLSIVSKGKSVTALEIEFGVLASKEQLSRSVFYLRGTLPYETFSTVRAAMYCDAYNPALSETDKQERKAALENLKTSIRKHFEGKNLSQQVKDYKVSWDETRERVTGLESWGEIVYEDILKECKEHAEETWYKVPQNWQEQEQALLDAFIENNTAAFCGRKELLNEVKEHLLSEEKGKWGMMLTGMSGSGKSAVFSMVKKIIEKENCLVLAHSAGLSPVAKKVVNLLQIWNKQLSDYLGIEEEQTDDELESADLSNTEMESLRQKGNKPEIEKIQSRFRELLFTAADKQQVVLLIDALDRFEPTERAQFMTWLPTEVPGKVKMLCTAVTGTEEKVIKYHTGLFIKNLNYITENEATEILETLCRQQHKTLPDKVEKIILEKEIGDGKLAASSPLWLSLAVNMLMALDYDDFEKISRLEGRGDRQIETYMSEMAADFEPLPGPLFLNLILKAGLVFGESFTNAVFNYLACSRNGLREKDLEIILNAENIEWDSLQFAGLRRRFKAHLILQGEEMQWNLAHSILRTALIQKAGETYLKKLHSNIAGYLSELDNDPLKASEILYHLLEAGRYRDAAYYYSSELDEEEITGATTALAETATTSENGLAITNSIILEAGEQFQVFHSLVRKYIYELNNLLLIEGNLEVRQTLLKNLLIEVENKYGINITDVYFIYDKGSLYEKLGEIYQTLGKFDQALKYFSNSNVLLKELYESNPKNESFKNGLAVSYEALGEIYEKLGKFDQALEYFNKYNELKKDIYESSKNESLKYGLAISYEKLGDIYQAQGQFEQALGYFNKVIKLMKELYKNNPQNESIKKDLGISYYTLGKTYQALSKINLAREYFSNSYLLLKELYESNPKNESIKHMLAISIEGLGGINQTFGQFDQALEYFNNYNGLMKELYESNPNNESLKKNFTVSYERLGTVYKSLNQFDQALEYYIKYNKLAKEFFERNPKNENFKEILAISYEKLGDINLALCLFDRALDYFNKDIKITQELYESNKYNENIKRVLAGLNEKLGEIYQALDQFERAQEYFNKDIKLMKELYENNLQNESVKKGLGISYYKLGKIYHKLGKINLALEYFSNSKLFLKELYESNPKNENAKPELAVLYEGLGDIYKAQEQFDQALEYFNKYNELTRELYENNSKDENLKYVFAVSYEKLGEIYKALGQYDLALEYYNNKLELTKQIYESNPKNERLKFNLAVSYDKLGDIYKTLDQYDQVLEYFNKYNELTKELYERNPDNESLKSGLAVSYVRIGEIYMTLDQFEQAQDYFNKGIELTTELLKSEPNNESLQERLAILYSKLGDIGDIYHSRGQFDLALEYFNKYFKLTKEIYENNPKNKTLKYGLAIAYLKLGEIYQSLSHNNRALEHFNKYNELTKELYEINSQDVSLLKGLGISYYKLAMLYKQMGNNNRGKEKFSEWKKIISFLAQNLPEVQKYQQWNELEYD